MRTISRCHKFENRLTLVEKGRKYFYLYHEKSINPVKIIITEEGKQAFSAEDWKYFENKEAAFFGGYLC